MFAANDILLSQIISRANQAHSVNSDLNEYFISGVRVNTAYACLSGTPHGFSDSNRITNSINFYYCASKPYSWSAHARSATFNF